MHDVLITLGVLALTGYVANISFFSQSLKIEAFQIDLGVIAALLTVIGYSLNDTIVILDRMRENRGKRPFPTEEDRKSTRLNSSHVVISYAVFCLKKKKNKEIGRAHV